MERQTIKIGNAKRNKLVELELEINEGNLSISGGVWNTKNTDYDTCGQIEDTLRYMLRKGEFKELYVDKADLLKLLRIWDEWHLNDLHAECIHQSGLVRYLKNRGQSMRYDDALEVPELKKCPICGYAYGSAWNTIPLPQDVVEFVQAFVEEYKDA